MRTSGRPRRPERQTRFQPTRDSLVEVMPVLRGRHSVAVFRMPGRELIAEDLFDDREVARQRAEDFGRLIRRYGLRVVPASAGAGTATE